ncbi:hypothetical protein ACLMJK_006560 [Lecanora helva]
MQGRNRSLKQDASTPSYAGSATHTPQQWFRPSLTRSVPNLARSHQQNKSHGFSSIKDFARTSRRPLAALPTNISQPPNHTVRASNSLYGTLRDQCSPPPPTAPELPFSSAIVLRRSQSSSADSVTPDQSGISTESSHPTTPSPAKHSAFVELSSGADVPSCTMGNKQSSLAKKSRSIKEKPNATGLDGQQEDSSEAPTKEPKGKQPATFSPRGSPAAVKVPTRRSSLTVLQPIERRPSTLAETIKPVESNTSTIKPLNIALQRDSTLSPPLLSPTSRLSSTSSQAPSTTPLPTSRSSVAGSRIHLPKTFPNGPIPMPVPRLTRIQYQCYANHKRLMSAPNRHCPVPCMACKKMAEEMWRCTFCMIRICPRCKTAFDARRRNLESLMYWLEHGRDREGEGPRRHIRNFSGAESSAQGSRNQQPKSKEEVEKEMEEQALRKVETAKKRETR